MRFRRDHIRRVKIAFAICISLSIIGCAGFPVTDKVVKIQIKGLNYPHAEIVFREDTPNESDLDIFLSEHYAIRIGLEWLKGQEETSPAEQVWFNHAEPEQLIPWFTCKYRF